MDTAFISLLLTSLGCCALCQAIHVALETPHTYIYVLKIAPLLLF